MTATAQLLNQRSSGFVRLVMERGGVSVLQESGCSKLRVPRGGDDAILINVSGGLAGGDQIDIAIEAGAGARLCVTTQAAERVYRTLGPAASVSTALNVADGAALFWLPQETILFEGSALSRRLDVTLARDATFVAVEPLVFGRHEMGEVVHHVQVEDQWRIWRDGTLIHAEAFKMGPEWPGSKARLGVHRAVATLFITSPEGEQLLGRLRDVLGEDDGASAWAGKLVARFVAKDGYELRKRLIQALSACFGGDVLPRIWTN